MATHRKGYRFRMRTTRSQEQSLNRLAGARRWVWNWALARWKETYQTTGKSISLKGCDRASAKDFHEIRAVFTRGVA